jgi:hypothetical protein
MQRVVRELWADLNVATHVLRDHQIVADYSGTTIPEAESRHFTLCSSYLLPYPC